MNKIKSYIANKNKTNNTNIRDFGAEATKHVSNFHKSIPNYSPTPLVNLQQLSKKLGVKNIYIKDESKRFDLNAFKVLGGSYSLAALISNKLGYNLNDLTYEQIVAPTTKEKLGDVTFVTATDGNHGRGVAWTAKLLNQKSVVYMPKGSALERLNNIKALGAHAEILDLNYDDAVRFANKMAEENSWELVQDTSWENYEEIPKTIMQGYTTMGHEIVDQIETAPTHIFLQAGVGAMAGAMTAFFSDYYKDNKPTIVIVEPDKADCLYNTASSNDGKIHSVGGDLNTIMAGLACGEPCEIAWNVLDSYADAFVSMPDEIAKIGMRTLGKPLQGDTPIISGESGAATTGFLVELLSTDNYADLKKSLNINENSTILCISTEGDTDKENYKKILSE